MMRQDGVIEGDLPTKRQYDEKSKNKKKNLLTNVEDSTTSHHKSKATSSKRSYPSCKHCGKKGHPPFKCRKRPKVRCSKCNYLGHEVIICKNKVQQQATDAQIFCGEKEDQLFVATCFSSIGSSDS